MKREEGYYWTKRYEKAGWTISLYRKGLWETIWSCEWKGDDDFYYIDENKIERTIKP